MSVWLLYAAHQSIDALIRTHDWQPLTASDWGTWSGAMGTVAALFWTIKLARVETRRREQQERDAAIVAASFMDLRLLDYQEILRYVIAALLKPVEDGTPFPYKLLAQKLESCPIWTREELQPLVYLGNHVAANLAMAQESVRDTAERLRKHSLLQSSSDDFELWQKSDLNREIAETLAYVLDQVKKAWGNCSDLLESARLV